VLIAEAVKLDTSTIVLILVVVLGAILVVATFVGGLGVVVGVALARASQSPEDRLALRRGSTLGAAVGGIGATATSWIVLLLVASPSTSAGQWLVFLCGVPLPIAWGWWLAQRYHFGARHRPPPSWPPPGAGWPPP
jgi:hypothetical protein